MTNGSAPSARRTDAALVRVRGGPFTMGSDRHYPEEAPTHQVVVDEFRISRATVTNREYEAFVKATGYRTVAERPLDPADYPGAPVENLVAGSLVFTMTLGPVDLRHLSQWWTWTLGPRQAAVRGRVGVRGPRGSERQGLRLGVDDRLVRRPASGGRRQAVLRAVQPPRAVGRVELRPGPTRFQGPSPRDQRGLVPVCRRVLPALPVGCPQSPDDRYRYEPSRLPDPLEMDHPSVRDELLPSWRDGAARAALVEFLAHADDIPAENRLAVFDNDGTLWCEKPRYPQLDFFIWQLHQAVGERPQYRDVPEYDALLRGDIAAVAGFGLERVASALLGLFDGIEPEAFEELVRAFFAESRHPTRGVRYDQMIYQPMLELLDALDQRGFTNCIVTGGGTEFLRAVSRRLYGVTPERVVGTLVTYVFDRRGGRPVLLRTTSVQGAANEGPAKIANIQVALGRRPTLAAGNSPGDAEMLDYTAAGDGPCLALLVNHDDEAREYAYESEAATFGSEESITATAARRGWTQVSMRGDWATVFPQL